jgi:hypothetical protein
MALNGSLSFCNTSIVYIVIPGHERYRHPRNLSSIKSIIPFPIMPNPE